MWVASDLSAAGRRDALRDFADPARDADIAVVYYAGHGLEVDGTNYLIPVDAALERDTDVYDEALLARPHPGRDRTRAGSCGWSSSMPAATIRSPRP